MRTFLRIAILPCVAMLMGVSPCDPASPPDQPLEGPGGSEYVHASVTESNYGSGGEEYWLFEPADPVPTSAPVVIFNHGFMLINPDLYADWIDHIVRKGMIVVYPRYQGGAFTPPEDHLPNAVAALQAAFLRLQDGTHVQPELDKVAVVGYSAGGLLAVNLAAVAATEGLPEPKAIVCVAPSGPEDSPVGSPDLLEDLSLIPAGTLLLMVAGEDDIVVGDGAARLFYNEATQIAVEDKDIVTVRSDDYGDPDLKTGHTAPLAGSAEADAIDFFAYWKLTDGLIDAAFYGINREYALGDTPEQRYMGLWSDGTPVHELVVED